MLKKGDVRLSDRIRIREEYFGGIAFNSETGDITEFDHEAYQLLVWLRDTGAADIRSLSRHKGERAILPALLGGNIIEYIPETSNTSDMLYPGLDKLPRDYLKPYYNAPQTLSAPETVHLAVTYRCNGSCPDCYTRKYISSTGHELNTEEMRFIVNLLADSGVFQLAIGGGEPFLRPDLNDIVSHAAGKGLVVHITTGQYAFMPEWVDVLKHIKTLHIGIRSEELVNDEADTTERLRALVEYITDYNVGVGANIIITRFTINHINRLTELLLGCGFKRFIFLRYKPIPERTRWGNEKPGMKELRFFRDWLILAKRRYPFLMLRVDCASAFLMKGLSPLAATHAGIGGCVAGERIAAVAPDGSVYPCSQLVGQAYKAGNLTRDPFKMIWRESEILNRYRNFRQDKQFIDSECGQCNANRFCGGCRVFAMDTIGCEPHCPLEI